MSRKVISIVAASAMASVLTVIVAANQSGQHDMPMGAMKNDMKKMTKAEKIANALSSAPAAISAKATIVDWPAKEGMTPEVLRPGTNGWTCLPDMPDVKGNAPMCLDEPWMTWVQAYLGKKPVQISKVGIGYMLAPGGEWGSNSDPYATMETKDNHWAQHGPHLMILVPDTRSLAGISTDSKNGGPYVMWAGTPYAHIMAPTTGPAMNH